MSDTETLADAMTFNAVALGERTDDTGWRHNLWLVTLGFEGRTFDQEYRMGTGLVDYHRRNPTNWQDWNKAEKERRIKYDHFGPGRDAIITPKQPTLRDVLSSLRLDVSSADQSFEDFCSDFGEDSDSRKAYKLYETCREIMFKLRTFFGARYTEFVDTEWEE